jgi:quercetin dioxygenase-like cupin family protein
MAETISVVLSGELHVEDMDGTQKIRRAGHYATTPAGRIHWEKAGPEGCVTFYTLTSADGLAFEIPEDGDRPAIPVTVDNMLTGAIDFG